MHPTLCFLVLLSFALCSAEHPETEHEFENLQLQQDSSSWLDILQGKQESRKKLNLFDLFHQLSKSENGINLQEPRDTENQEKKRRGVGSGFTTSRAPCRVFFWKSWATC